MVAEMPIDNRTVNKFAALGRHLGVFSPVWDIATDETI
jgi:hypothetical protein